MQNPVPARRGYCAKSHLPQADYLHVGGQICSVWLRRIEEGVWTRKEEVLILSAVERAHMRWVGGQMDLSQVLALVAALSWVPPSPSPSRIERVLAGVRRMFGKGE